MERMVISEKVSVPTADEYALPNTVQVTSPKLSAKDRLVLRSHRYVRSKIASLAPKAVDYIGAVMRDEEADPALRYKAAESVLDRFIGRPQQSVAVEHVESRPIVFSAKLEELREAAMRAVDAESVAVDDGTSA